MKAGEYGHLKRILLLISITVLIIFLAAIISGCGKKGDLKPAWKTIQMPPPQKIDDLTASVRYGKVWLNFTEPKRNVSGNGPVNIDRYEIYYEVMDLGTSYCLTCPLNLSKKIEIDPAYSEKAVFEGGKAKIPVVRYLEDKKYVLIVRAVSPEGASAGDSNTATLNFAGQ